MSASNFWWLAKIENLANTDFKNLKHLQNLGIFLWMNLISTSYVIVEGAGETDALISTNKLKR